MAITLIDRKINKIHIIDDDSEGRDGYQLAIEEMSVEPIVQNERVENIEKYLLSLNSEDAVVSDHHLKKASSYFPINGAEFVSKCYERRIPSLLVTKYEQASYHEIRPFKHRIPVVLKPEEFNPDSLVASYIISINEFKGNIIPSRKTWRTLVRLDDVDEKSVMAILPSWNRNFIIDLRRTELPPEIEKAAKVDSRFYAFVNIDAEDPCELFFHSWEIIPKK